MNKDAKATEYRIEPIVKMLRSEAISDGGTEKKASELEGKWIQLNESEYVLEEAGKVTRVFHDDTNCGCACGKLSHNVLCEHLIAFEDLKSKPSLTIESKECRWLQEYLFSLEWTSENRYLYPPIGDVSIDPVNEDKPLDIGVGKEAEPKTYERKCAFCGEINAPKSEKGADEWLVWHESICPKNPANTTEIPGSSNDVTIDETDVPIVQKEKPTVVKDATVEEPEPTPEVKESLTTDKPKAEKPPKEENKVKQQSNTRLIDTIKKYVGNDVLEIFGDTGSGKSKFALEIAREAIDAGLKVFYLDSERNLTDDDVKMLGRGYKYTPVLKEIDTTIQKLPAVDIVIIDSIGFPILTAYARYNMKQKGDALLTMIAMFGDLKQWAYRNNGLVIVVNQPESTFNKESGHILRPFGDKSQFAAKEIWWLKMVKRADKTTDHHTEILITSFRSRTLGHGDKLYTMNVRKDGIEFVPMR